VQAAVDAAAAVSEVPDARLCTHRARVLAEFCPGCNNRLLVVGGPPGEVVEAGRSAHLGEQADRDLHRQGVGLVKSFSEAGVLVPTASCRDRPSLSLQAFQVAAVAIRSWVGAAIAAAVACAVEVAPAANVDPVLQETSRVGPAEPRIGGPWDAFPGQIEEGPGLGYHAYRTAGITEAAVVQVAIAALAVVACWPLRNVAGLSGLSFLLSIA
jgi:hypothetical protein